MVIAVNTRFLVKDEPGKYGNFIREIFSRITQSHKQHTFIFIFDGPYNPEYIFSANIIPVVTGPRATNPAQWYIWYNIKIPAVLRKYKAEVFVSPDGFCSLGTKIPQCILIHDLDFLNHTFSIKKSHTLFYKKFVPRFLKKSKFVITVSQFNKIDIIKNYNTNAEKIEVVYEGISEEFKPSVTEEKEMTKAKYAEGNEYFIYLGDISPHNNLLNLLKAFSAFKKRQKSSMQLLIAGKPGLKYEDFLQDLRLFRFKHDVKILEDLPIEEIVRITASAYAMIDPSTQQLTIQQALGSMKCEVPVIISSSGIVREIFEEAALYVDPKNFKDIAVQMMLIFKDENLRNKLIEKGKLQVEQYSWDKSAKLFWDAINKTAVQ